MSRAAGGDDGTAAARAARLAGLGPFFGVRLHDPGSARPDGWLPLAAIGSPAVLGGRVTAVRAALAGCRPTSAVPARVAASVTHLGLAARLVSPALGLATLCGIMPAMDPAEVRWRPASGGPVPLSLPVTALTAKALPAGTRPAGALAAGADPDGGHADESELAAGLAGLLGGPVRLLTDATAAMSVSRTVLWGNVASAVHGAATVIGIAEPRLARRAATIGSAVLNSPPLAGAGTVTASGFRRHSCCLIYRAADPPARTFCADCILSAAAAPVSRPGAPRPGRRTAPG